LLAFVGPCPVGMECRHLDGNRSNNNLSNIEWSDHLTNMADRKKHGTNRGGIMHGQDNPAAKLTSNEVVRIRSLHAAGSSTGRLATLFKVSRKQINRIIKGKNW
jgi:DNA invertase Pin-like site-specific DNA recombinase